MGLLMKAFLFIVALVAFGLGAWILSLPIFAYLLLPLFLRSRKVPRERRRQEGKGSARSSTYISRVVGASLLLLGFVAIAEGGTYSPIVFGVPGFLLLALPSIGPSLASKTRPVNDSILLRGIFLPFRWFAVASVKVATRDPAGALSGLSERFVVRRNPPEIFVILAADAISRAAAERAILAKMRSVATALVPLGVYLLPQVASDVPELTALHSRVKVPEGQLMHFLSSTQYESLFLEGRNGVIESFDLHDGAWDKASALSRPTSRPRSTVFIREALDTVFQKSGPQRPDEYTVFLSGMAATVGETMGQRVVESKVEDDGQAVEVSSVGSPKVLLSRVQFRAVTSVYE